MDIKCIIGIPEVFLDILIASGYTTTEQLIPLTAEEIKEMSKEVGIPANLIDMWQEHADLMQIEGVDPKMANALNGAGVNSTKDLARRKPIKTHEKLIIYYENNPGMMERLPSEEEVENWINSARVLHGKPIKNFKDNSSKSKSSKSSTPSSSSKHSNSSTSSSLPIPSGIVPQPALNDYGKYGLDYWNNKWEKAPIIYAGRALRGKLYKEQIDCDVRSFLKSNDAILEYVIDEMKLKKPTFNETAFAVQKFVNEFLEYNDDEVSNECVEYWQFPFETIQSQVGDCEDGAILTASLLLNCGIPSWRVKCVGGGVMEDPIFAPITGDGDLGGHGWCIYLADRSESERKLEWVILDWCYQQSDAETKIEEKPLARDGGLGGAYKEIWFTHNDIYSWGKSGMQISSARISRGRKARKEDVLNEIGGIIDRVFMDFNILIDNKELRRAVRKEKKHEKELRKIKEKKEKEQKKNKKKRNKKKKHK